MSLQVTKEEALESLLSCLGHFGSDDIIYFGKLYKWAEYLGVDLSCIPGRLEDIKIDTNACISAVMSEIECFVSRKAINKLQDLLNDDCIKSYFDEVGIPFNQFNSDKSPQEIYDDIAKMISVEVAKLRDSKSIIESVQEYCDDMYGWDAEHVCDDIISKISEYESRIYVNCLDSHFQNSLDNSQGDSLENTIDDFILYMKEN